MSSDQTTELERAAAQLGKGAGRLQKFNRLLAVLRHYRWDQISRRVQRVIAQRIFKNATVSKTNRVPDVPQRREGPKECFQQLAEAIVATESTQRCGWDGATHQLTLLNLETKIPWPIDWKNLPEDRSHLWRFQLHYQEYLLVTKNCDPSFAWEFILGWIDAYPPEETLQSDDSWHPYCISRRLPVWVWLLSMGQPTPDTESKILQSISQQADYLSNHLELDLGGNHLLENLTALAITGLFLESPSADRWLEIVEKHLRTELQRQVLKHGEHFELSPMYHCQVLGNLLRIYAVAQRVRPNLADLILPYAQRMLEFLGHILHPDGKIPLFADSGFDEAPSAVQIRAIASLCELSLPVRTQGGRVGNYFLFSTENSEDFMIFDTGPVGAPELPAHAHCDLLTFELSIGGNRWIVDSGNYNYQDDSMRAYCRSTLAHNAPTIDGTNCCDVWSKFRMGRRGEINLVKEAYHEEIDWCFASHNGYSRLGAKRLSRLMGYLKTKSVFSCVDHCENQAVQMDGYLHLAPEIEAKKVSENSFRLQDIDENVRFLSFHGAEHVEIQSGWYCPSFGTRIQNQTIRYSRHQAKLAMGWLLGPDLSDCEIKFDQHSAGLNVGESQHAWSFSPSFTYQNT